MNIAFDIICGLAIVGALTNLIFELKRDLMMLQQNSYRRERYFKWISTSGDSTSLMRLGGMAVFLGAMVIHSVAIIGAAMILIFTVANSLKLLTARYKKPLVFTPRAMRIFITSIVIALIAAAAVLGMIVGCYDGIGLLYGAAIIFLGEYCASHVIITLANGALSPVEKHINREYYDDARRILRSMPDLKVIGITGSYGKTSTKHYLYTILSEQFETVMTPGSYNTTLGVVRTVREYLKPYTEVFIAEMGAKQRGDIREICELVEPQIGIVTAVGEMHLETFGSIDNIQATKFELVDALPAKGGFAVVNDDFDMIAKREVTNVTAVRYAVENTAHADAIASNISIDARGTTFTLTYAGEQIEFSTRLVGRCNVSNLIASIVVALHLGMDVQAIRRGVQRIQQVEHRLSLKRGGAETVIIDDAFNSNPVGAAMALEVLASMKGGKRIIITPGMIELGEKQYDENFRFGERIAESADVAIVVGEYNRTAITEGIRSKQGATKLYEVGSFTEAQRLLSTIIGPGDAILYENDLPDTFK